MDGDEGSRGRAGSNRKLFWTSVAALLMCAVTAVISIVILVNVLNLNQPTHMSPPPPPPPSTIPPTSPPKPSQSSFVIQRSPDRQLVLDITSKKLSFAFTSSSATQPTVLVELGKSVGYDPEITGSGQEFVGIRWPSTGSELKISVDNKLSTEKLTVFDVSWTTKQLFTLADHIQYGSAHWYGGCENFTQNWPLEKSSTPLSPYVTADIYWAGYGGVLERYWLSSDKLAITVDNDVPLWVAMNPDKSNKMILQSQYKDTVYKNFVDITTTMPHLRYKIWMGTSMKQVHLEVINRHFGKPTGIPDTRMLVHPVWSTWAKMHKHVNQTNVIEFAEQIIANGFNNSQIEIDDEWTPKYGDWVFNVEKFPNVTGMVEELKEKNFRITVWVHPFANSESKTLQTFDPLNGREKQPYYFVRQKSGRTAIVKWWDGFGASVDPTSPEAVDWFVGRLEKFRQETGIDSFKFDAGEVHWLPDDFVLANGEYPGRYTQKYVEMCAKLGTLIEVRVGEGSQQWPIFVRVMDKDSRWGLDNGLKAMITSTLTIGILGYPFILPDMVGGNAYGNSLEEFAFPEEGLYLRWLAANVFLPSIQFSIEPWHYSTEAVEAAKKLIKIRESVGEEIIDLARRATISGEPIIRPIWWLEETEEAWSCDDEYLMGDDILVAPVVAEGAMNRTIYLPKGTWKSMIDDANVTHVGPTTIDQNVNYDQVAWFRRQSA